MNVSYIPRGVLGQGGGMALVEVEACRTRREGIQKGAARIRVPHPVHAAAMDPVEVDRMRMPALVREHDLDLVALRGADGRPRHHSYRSTSNFTRSVSRIRRS